MLTIVCFGDLSVCLLQQLDLKNENKTWVQLCRFGVNGLTFSSLGGGGLKWSGMIGQVQRDEVDASVGTVFYFRSRVAVSDAPQPLVYVYSLYIVPRFLSLDSAA